MVGTEDRIRKEIQDFIEENRGDYSSWYVGVSRDPEEQLFQRHNVNRQTGLWIYRAAETPAAAQRVQQGLLDLGTAGRAADAPEDARVVYAYHRTDDTKP